MGKFRKTKLYICYVEITNFFRKKTFKNQFNSSLSFSIFKGFLILIDSMQAMSVQNNGNDDDDLVNVLNDNRDDTSSSFQKRTSDHGNAFPDEFHGLILPKRRHPSRGVRLPSEPVLLGKRRLPYEAVLLGRRYIPNDDDLLSKRR
jgi:hypothetical protein